MQEEKIQRYLMTACKGRRNSQSSRSVEQTLMVSSKELRRNINRLRQNGVPVASCDAGYYYAETAGDIYATIRQLQKMRSGLDAAIRGLEESLKAFSGQGGDT